MKASEGIQNYKAKVKECVNYCVKEIKYVCKEIGGRESGSPAERKAQEHMADELRKYTDSVELEICIPKHLWAGSSSSASA